MCALVEGFRRRARGVPRLATLLAVAWLGAGCEAMVTRQYSHDVGELSNADGIEVTFAYRLTRYLGRCSCLRRSR
jgi:hypothetical protein